MPEGERVSRPLAFPIRIPFVEQVGFELWRFENGQAELRLALDPMHLNALSTAHGGVLMTMLDVVMAHAARSAVAPQPEQGQSLATIEMKTSFLRPAQRELRAHGQLIHRTKSLAFCEGRVVDAAGELCAQATGTFRLLRAATARAG